MISNMYVIPSITNCIVPMYHTCILSYPSVRMKVVPVNLSSVNRTRLSTFQILQHSFLIYLLQAETFSYV
jgi:hypothetical protein